MFVEMPSSFNLALRREGYLEAARVEATERRAAGLASGDTSLGIIEYNAGNLTAARDLLRSAARAGDVEALEILSTLSIELGEGQGYLDLVLTLSGQGVPGLRRLAATAYASMGMDAKADTEFTQALAEGDSKAWLDRGLFRMDRGDLDGAKADLEAALQVGDAKAYWGLGSLQLMLGDGNSAVQALSRGLEHNQQGVIPELVLALQIVGRDSLAAAIGRDFMIVDDGSVELADCLDFYEDSWEVAVVALRASCDLR